MMIDARTLANDRFGYSVYTVVAHAARREQHLSAVATPVGYC